MDDPKDFGLVTGPIRPRPAHWLPDDISGGGDCLRGNFSFMIGKQIFHIMSEPILQPGDDAASAFRQMLDSLWQQAEGARLRAQGGGV